MATVASSLGNTGASIIVSPRKMSDFKMMNNTPAQKRNGGSMLIEGNDPSSFRNSLEPTDTRGNSYADNLRQKKGGSVIDGAMYSTISHHGGNGSKIMSKWNVSFANSFGSKEANMETLNRGASFLVAPHNVSFNKHTK